jgi:branched-chain amino acid transport system substrate-binding protein
MLYNNIGLAQGTLRPHRGANRSRNEFLPRESNQEETTMTRRLQSHGPRIRRRSFMAAAAAGAAAAALPLRFAHAQGQKLRIGLLLQRSGVQAQIGIDCQRGADVAPEILKAKGYPEVEFVLGDTESKPEVSRAQAEKLIGEGIHVLVGCFDSGQTMAAAQVCEQKGIPFVVNIAAVPALTEQGYKTVFRNFPTGPMIATDSFNLQKTLFQTTGKTPQTVVMLHVNDTFGVSQRDANVNLAPKFQMPYKFLDTISYDPAARDLSAEVRKAKASGAEMVWVISRLNDAILLCQEMVKQRWEPMGIISSGPGWYEVPFMNQLKQYSDDVVSTVPWHDPNKPMSKALDEAFKKKFPDRELNTNHTYTFEAILVAADAYKRAGSTEPGKLIEALRKTDLKDNVVTGTGVSFNEKGQNPNVKNSAIQNRGGKNLVVLPAEAANAKPNWPMRPWNRRG